MPRGDRRECPSCGTHDTSRAHTEWYARYVEEVRICNNCPVQFTNVFTTLTVDVDQPDDFTNPETDGFETADELEDVE